MSERTTLIVSALAALAILGLGVTAQQTGGRLENRAEALESDLRFQLEMTWRHDGKTREARLASLEQTLDAWRKSPQTAADRLLLENWLQRSIVNSLPGESGVFPPTPEFATVRNGEESAAPKTPAVQPVPAAPRDHELRPGQAYTPPRAKEIHLTPRRPEGAGAQAVVPPPERVIAAKPVTPAEESPAVEPPKVEATPPAVEQLQPADASKIAEAIEAPPRVANVERKSAPTAAEVGEIYREERSPGATPGAGRPGSPGAKVAEGVPAVETPRVAPRREPVMVNLAELNAQIRGYHDGLHEVEATVVRERGKLTVGQIARLVGELEQLAGQHQFVRLYYDGLSDRERRLVTEPRSMADTIDLVDRQRAALVEEEGDFLTTLEADVEEDELQQRLKAIKATVGVTAEKDAAAKRGGEAETARQR